MVHSIADYSARINLEIPFKPTTGAADPVAVVAAIKKDKHSRSFVSHHPFPTTPEERRQWIQAALTIRPAGDLPDELVKQMDRLLQRELQQKQITVAADLPRLTGSYPIADCTSIWDGDTATLRVGAITNAANHELLGCFQPFHACIDNVIHNAAGPQLREDCAKLIQVLRQTESTGSAKITRAYNLPSDFLLHTVGPIVRHRQPSPEQQRELYSCYTNCLSLAAELGIKSIALCGISTGVFGYPADQATGIALRAVADWFARRPGVIEHVVFNTYGEAATALYKKEIEQWH